jgi:hypothetical protein
MARKFMPTKIYRIVRTAGRQTWREERLLWCMNEDTARRRVDKIRELGGEAEIYVTRCQWRFVEHL